MRQDTYRVGVKIEKGSISLLLPGSFVCYRTDGNSFFLVSFVLGSAINDLEVLSEKLLEDAYEKVSRCSFTSVEFRLHRPNRIVTGTPQTSSSWADVLAETPR